MANSNFELILRLILSSIVFTIFGYSQEIPIGSQTEKPSINIAPDQLRFKGHVATKSNTIGYCTESLLSDLPDRSIILGLNPNSCNPEDWQGGSASVELFLSNIHSPTIYVLNLSWPDRKGRGLRSPGANGSASILLNGKQIWNKRTTHKSTSDYYYGAEHESIVTTIVITNSETYHLTFEVSAQTLWDLSSIEMIAYPYPNRMKGIGYSPYRDCQYPGGENEPSAKEIKADLLRLFHTATAIRTYGATGVNRRIPAIAKSIGLPVFAGAWIDGNTEADDKEIQALIDLANSVELDGLIIGNEYYLRHRGRDDAKYLLNSIIHVKNAIKNKETPISTAEISSLIFDWDASPLEINSIYRPILDEINFLLVHIYPFWEQKPIDGAAAYTVEQYKAIQRLIEEKYPGENKKVIIGETGWPSAGRANGLAVPSPENQKRYLCEFLSLAETEGVEYMYFDAFDELWKVGEPGFVGQNWGYSYSDRSAKYNFYGVLIPSAQLLPFWTEDIKTTSESTQQLTTDAMSLKVYDEWPTISNPVSEVSHDSGGIARFIPSGFMGDIENIQLSECDRSNPHKGKMAAKVSFSLSDSLGWGGIYWLANGKWHGPGISIYDALGVSLGIPMALTFWARGKIGGEMVKFQVGGVSNGNDSIEFPLDTGWLQLDRDWREYTIDLADQDLSNVVGGFCWVSNRRQNRGRAEIEFFLDDICFQLSE